MIGSVYRYILQFIIKVLIYHNIYKANKAAFIRLLLLSKRTSNGLQLHDFVIFLWMIDDNKTIYVIFI